MNKAVMLALLGTHAPAWKKSFETLEKGEWDLPTITENLRPHLQALERAHEISNRETEGETALAFMAMWNARPNTPDVFIGLMQATCHRWLLDPPVACRAWRLARERKVPVFDEFGRYHCPHGIIYPGEIENNPCKECCSECGGCGFVRAIGPDGEPSGETCERCSSKFARTVFPPDSEEKARLRRDLLGLGQEGVSDGE